MVDSATFGEAGVVVDSRFVKFGSTSVRASEIKQVHSSSYRTDGHTARVAWGFVSVIFLIWVVAPLQNAFMIPLLIAFGSFAFWKQTHPKPPRHRVIVSAGNMLGSTVLDTADAEQARRLQAAIEAAMVGEGSPTATVPSPWSDQGGMSMNALRAGSEVLPSDVIQKSHQIGGSYGAGAEPRVAKGWWWLFGVGFACVLVLGVSLQPVAGPLGDKSDRSIGVQATTGANDKGGLEASKTSPTAPSRSLFGQKGASSSASAGAEKHDTLPGLDIWQSAGVILDLPPTEAERRLTNVAAAHGKVASDAFVRQFVGALLRFRDKYGVDPARVLVCTESGVRSPLGSTWQDTMSYCVVELE